MTRKTRKKRRKGSSRRDWMLVIGAGAAVVVLAWLVWALIGERRSSDSDFGVRLYELAARRGADPQHVTADEPIRKIDGVFVRSWQIGLPDRPSLQALIGDIATESARWNATVREAPVIRGETAHLRLDLGAEAFDIQLVVAGRERVVDLPPTPSPAPARRPTVTPRPEPDPSARGRLAILLDDAGQNSSLLAQATLLPPEIGVAVLPFLPQSGNIAVEMHRTGHEVWLHLPMEPEGYPGSDPGPGAIFVDMTDDTIRTTVNSAVNNIPFAVGVNNHMGSRATADLRTMTWVMQELAGRGMAFIDSRTTRHTVAEEAARSQGVKANRRHVFLDNERNAGSVRRQLDEAVYRSRVEGEIIAIGHLAPVTVEVLAEELPRLAKRGADLVRPTALVH